MSNRAFGFVALLAVMGVSIIFGMIIGGKLNAPHVMFAAPGVSPLQLAPATTLAPAVPDFADVVDSVLPAVVRVTSRQLPSQQGQQPERRPEDLFRWFFGDPERFEGPPRMQPRIGEGSGFIISPDGFILTNNHVVAESNDVRVRLRAGREYKAEVIGTDPSIDLALLKVDGNDLPTLPLGDSRSLRVGEWVIAVGNPLEFEQTVTVGVVSGKGRRVPIGDTDVGVVSFIQTDAAINFGNSGGPLIDARGNVIGINTAIRRANFAEGIGFALPIDHAKSVMTQLRERGYVRRGYIGITMNRDGIDDNAREYLGLPDTRGVIVDEVQPDGPADRAGLRAGDIIRKVDGDTVVDNNDLIAKIASRQPGEKVHLEVYRKERPDAEGKNVRLTATLVDRNEELQARSGSARPSPQGRGGEDQPAEATGLGLTVENLTPRTRERLGLEAERRGVLVTDVDYDSEAYAKEVQPNMIVTGVNDRPVTNVGEWNRELQGLRSGAPVKLTLVQPNPQGPARTLFVYLRAP